MKKQLNNLKISSKGLAASSGYRTLNIEDIRNVAQGACFLASGGVCNGFCLFVEVGFN